MIYQYKITLKEVKPAIWRRFQVRSAITFHQLHETIQIVMGWDNYHMYEFFSGQTGIGLPDPHYPSPGSSKLKSKSEIVEQHFRLEGQKMDYNYDFGDDWAHEVVLEKILPEEDKQYPICIDGQRACPPEDCGGSYGYEMLLEIMADPKHPEYQERMEWLGGWFKPESFNPEPVNYQLSRKPKALNPKAAASKKTASKPAAKPNAKPEKLTPTKLKRCLQDFAHPELVDLLIECFKSSKEAEEFLTTKILRD